MNSVRMDDPNTLSCIPSAPLDVPSKAPQVHRLSDLKQKLQKVAESRGKQYGRYMAVLVHWALDNTNAEQDVATMKGVLEHTFGFDVVKVVLIAANNPYPGWTVESSIQELLQKHLDPNVHSLLVFFYAGHGTMFQDDFYLTTNKKMILWSRLQETIFGESQCEFKSKLDALAILDCCFSGRAARTRSGRITQILAASMDGTWHRGKGPMSFTQKIERAIMSLRQFGSTVSTASILSKIIEQDPRPKPSLITISGSHPIVFTFNQKVQPKSKIPVPLKHVNSKHVLVKLTVHGNKDAFESFSRVIKGLPAGMAAEITDAYETDQSFFCLLQMTWETFAILSMAIDLEQVGTTVGPSLVHKTGLTELDPAQGHAENVPHRPKRN